MAKKTSFWSKVWGVIAHKRVRTLLWQCLGAAVIGVLAYLVGLLPELGLTEGGLVVATFILNGLTKAANNKWGLKK